MMIEILWEGEDRGELVYAVGIGETWITMPAWLLYSWEKFQYVAEKFAGIRYEIVAGGTWQNVVDGMIARHREQ
jgi:hypothetical protein